MTQRRSKRTSAITKRRLLEETLNKRRSAAEKRKLIVQSRKELDCFNQEAQNLTNLVQRLLHSDTESEESVDTLERTVNEIIDEINTLGNSPDSEFEQNKSQEETNRRRKTSTDDHILDELIRENLNHFPILNWPPRNPSEEPELFHPLHQSSFNHEEPVWNEEENLIEASDEHTEVFEEDSDSEIDSLTEQILGENFKHLLRPELRRSRTVKAVALSIDTTKGSSHSHIKWRKGISKKECVQ